ncbi:MAG: hypothetical protein ACTSUE_15670 [Promethearchaeota archaeon]
MSTSRDEGHPPVPLGPSTRNAATLIGNGQAATPLGTSGSSHVSGNCYAWFREEKGLEMAPTYSTGGHRPRGALPAGRQPRAPSYQGDI